MVITVGLHESKIVGTMPAHVRHELERALSFEDLNHVRARAIAKRRNGGKLPPHLRWDGITHLYRYEKGTFPSGLVPKVKAILDGFNVQYTAVEDYTIPTPYTLSLKGKDAASLVLMNHQRACIDAIKETRNGIAHIGTGGGKTITSIVAAQEIGQLPVLFLVHRVKLLTQAHYHYERLLGEKVGMIGNGDMTFGRFNIATVNTICSLLKLKYDADDEESLNYTPEQVAMLHALLKSCRMVIVDECHHAASDMYKKLMSYLPNTVYRIGLSATPVRTDGKDILLEAAFGPTFYHISASELIRLGVLARPTITFVRYKDPAMTAKYPMKFKKGQRKANFSTVYKNAIVENPKYSEVIAKLSAVNAKMGRLTLVSVRQVVHGDNIFKAIKTLAPDVPSQFLNGKNRVKINEEKVIDDFTKGDLRILISTILDEGVDIPAIDAGIFAGGGKSPVTAMQFPGRAMRKYPGKDQCYIYIIVAPYTYTYDQSLALLEIFKTEPEFVIKVMDI